MAYVDIALFYDEIKSGLLIRFNLKKLYEGHLRGKYSKWPKILNFYLFIEILDPIELPSKAINMYMTITFYHLQNCLHVHVINYNRSRCGASIE